MARIPRSPNIDTPPVARIVPPPDMAPPDGPSVSCSTSWPDPELNGGGRTQTERPASAQTSTSEFAHPEARPEAAGPGYAGEWGLFCDYAAATDQPALPTTVAALTGFLAALPARPGTVARRVRAIAAAHRRAGHLLTRPEHGPAAPPSTRRRGGPTPG